MNIQSNDSTRDYEAVLRLAPITFLVLTEELRILRANGDSSSVLNMSNEQLVNANLCEILTCCDKQEFAQDCSIGSTISLCFQKGNKQETIVELLMDSDLESKFLFLTVVPLREQSERSVLVSLQDVTAWRQVDQAFQRAHSFNALGTLAGSIAHEFNNLLTTIVGKVSLVRAQLENNEELDSQLRDVLEVSFKAAGLADELLTFASGGSPIKEECEVELIVEETISCTMIPFTTKVSVDKETELPFAAADKQQLKIALANLFVNSAEAMDYGGNVEVSLSKSEFSDDNEIGLPSGVYIAIKIKDEGPGIPVRDLSRVCDPYFTTKEGANGLGLTAAYSIVQRHGGELKIQTRWREGTIVTIYLPVWRDVEQPRSFVELPEVSSKRILIMDDDDGLRDALGVMLEFLGWEVTQTSCGEEALEEYESALKKGNPFRLVILDLIICCGMGGDETMRRLLEIDPSVKAIVSSGYSIDPIMAEHKKYGFLAALPKPYSLHELDNLISQATSPVK